MSALLAWLLAVVLLAAASAVRATCPPGVADGAGLRDGTVQLAWRAEPAEPRVGEPLSLLLTVCPAQAVLVAVDAAMPEHRHGMNYRPSLQPLGDGRWRADGLLWHMSGRWELRFDVRHEGRTHVLRQVVMLR